MANNNNMFIEDTGEDEEKRPNLLDLIEERNRSLNKKNLLHRMVVISRMRNEKYNEIIAHYEKMFKEVQMLAQCEPVTGHLILFPHHCVNIIEGSVEYLLELARDLRKEKKEKTGTMEISKILVISHDIPVRMYQMYITQVLDIVSASIDTFEATDAVENVVTEFLTQLMNLGIYINKHPKGTQRTLALETLLDKVPDLVPQQDVVQYLLKNEFVCLFTPEDYLKKYEVPFDSRMPGDLLWPLPSRLFPYN